ncbi:hypothetical protein M513_10616 [Trichuris suis]|uniref:Uncharacterized protein n=1 Tax=Trichuris suis TaxID=68888 RepID=A0A085LU36_9BILA|nr:hypothetical protein M513_10616 [Trichuris suis]
MKTNHPVTKHPSFKILKYTGIIPYIEFYSPSTFIKTDALQLDLTDLTSSQLVLEAIGPFAIPALTYTDIFMPYVECIWYTAFVP